MGNSLAVRQFMTFCRGESRPSAPQKNHVRRLETVTRLCLRCNNFGDHDQIEYTNGSSSSCICRTCRHLVHNGSQTNYVMLDDGSLVKIERAQS